jgi:hypothetical protein
MEPLEASLEVQLQKNVIDRSLQDLYDQEAWEELHHVACILNCALHQRDAALKWLAKEACKDLGELNVDEILTETYPDGIDPFPED